MVVSVWKIPRQVSVTVGTTAVDVSPEPGANPRLDLVITNTSTAGQVISLGFGTDAVAGVGLVLLPTASVAFSRSENYEVINTRINAIATAAGGTLGIYERSEGA